MLLDSQNKFSDRQAITANDVSENVIDMGKGEASFGTPKPLLIQVVEDFNNLTSLKVEIQTATDPDFTTPETLAESTQVLEKLKTGYVFPITTFPKGNKGYMRLKYTVAGTAPTQGRITGGLVASHNEGWHDV